MKKVHVHVTCAFALTAAGAVAQQAIQDLAPPDSFMIIGADDLGASVERFKAGPIWGMLQDPQLAEMRAHMDALKDMLAQVEQELDLAEGSVGLPRGSAGAALFVTMNEELGFETMGMMFSVEFRGQGEVLAAIMDKAVEDGGMEPDQELLGHDVYAITMQEPPAEGAEDDMGGMDMEDPMAMIEPMAAGMETMYLTRTDTTLLGSTSLDALRGAIEATQGDDIASVGESEAYRAAADQIGDADMRIVVLVDGLAKAANLQPMMMFVGPMLTPVFESLGFSGIRAISSSMDLESDGALMEQRVAVLLDGEKTGLLGLLDSASPRGAVPGFVGADSTGYTHFNIEFSGLMPVIEAAINAVPELAAEADPMMTQFGPDLTAAFGAMGPDVHVVSGPNGMVVAIRCNEPARLEGVIAKYAPQGGMTPRDFLGHTIYSAPDGPAALGLGGGYAVIGEAAGVEAVLRAAGLRDVETLESSAAFKAASDAIGSRPVIAWGYSDVSSLIEEIGAAAEGMGEGMGAPAGALPELPDAALLRKYIGPSVWRLESTPSGFVMTSYTLRAAD